jgi:hypothetical protein
MAGETTKSSGMTCLSSATTNHGMSEASCQTSSHGGAAACHPGVDNDCDHERFVPVKADDPRLLGEGPCGTLHELKSEGPQEVPTVSIHGNQFGRWVDCKVCALRWDIGHAWVPAVGQLADHHQPQYGLPSLCCGGLGAGSAARQWTCEPRCRLWKARHVWRGACLPCQARQHHARPAVGRVPPPNHPCNPSSAQRPWQAMADQIVTSLFRWWSLLSELGRPGCWQWAGISHHN